MPHELPRQRLLELLHRHGSRSLIQLVAPAGFGKSTLAAAYVRESGAVVGWLTLQASDRDSRAVFGRLAEVLEAGFASPLALGELRAGLAAGAEGIGLARLLRSDLARAPAGFILVLDDFHVVQDSDDVLQAVDTLVRELPEMGQVVLTSRTPPPLSMTRLVASDEVFSLGADDLRFTQEESQALREALGGDASQDAKAEGWVTGILLGGAPRQLGVGSGSLLGAYVDREVLSRLGSVAQRWLETLAVLESITPSAAERLLGPGAWSHRLAALAERCPFLLARGDGTYRLHSLIRESLLNRLRRGPAARAARAWTLARELAEATYDTPGVVRTCQELGRLEDAVLLVRRTAEASLRAGRWSAMLAAVELLPAPARRAHPDICLLEAHALVQSSRPDAARLAAEAALQHGGRSGDALVQIASSLELANIARYVGDLAAATDWLSAADYLLVHAQLPPMTRRLLEGRSLGLRGVCQAVQGDSVAGRELLASAERLLALNGSSRELAVVLQNLGKLCVRVGDLPGAQGALAAATTHWRLLGDRMALAATQSSLGSLYLRMGNLNGAGTALLSAIDQARAVGAVRVEAHALATLGEWHRASGRVDDAVEHLDASLGLAEELGERELLVAALQLRAEVAILQGDISTARAMLTRGQAEGQRLGAEFEQAGIELALGRLHLAEGLGERAVRHLETALRQGAHAWGPSERLDACYWLGTAHLTNGSARLAETALHQALELARQTGGASALARSAAQDLALLQHGLRIGLEPLLLGEAERIAMTRRPWTGVQRAVGLELVVANDLPRVEARLFGTFTLHCDGQLATAGPRGHLDRARELLALLILHPSGLPEQSIVGLLWPDMAPQQALHNLRMTAYLLRRFLRSKAAVRYGASAYQLAPQLELWADVRQYDAALQRARTSSRERARDELAAAVELYRGPLLADAGWPWLESLRLTYQSRFVDAALHLADLTTGVDVSGSDNLAEQVLQIEPDNEAAYDRLMRNAAARGDTLAQRRAVQRYERAAAHFGFAATLTTTTDRRRIGDAWYPAAGPRAAAELPRR